MERNKPCHGYFHEIKGAGKSRQHFVSTMSASKSRAGASAAQMNPADVPANPGDENSFNPEEGFLALRMRADLVLLIRVNAKARIVSGPCPGACRQACSSPRPESLASQARLRQLS
jgi:hypothetical protein